MLLSPDHEQLVRIVLFGPAGAGKATCLQYLQRLAPERQLMPLDLDGRERGLELRIGTGEELDGMPLVLSAATISGQSIYASSRRALLAHVDGIMFVNDATREALDADIECMNELADFLRSAPGVAGMAVPMVMLYNKQDLPSVIPTEQLNPLLNHRSEPHFNTIATKGEHLLEAWKTLTERVLADIHDGRKETAAGTDAPAPEPRSAAAPQPPPPAGQQDGSYLLFCHHCQAMLEIQEVGVGEVLVCGSCGHKMEVVDPERGLTSQPQTDSGRSLLPDNQDSYHMQSGASPEAQPGLELSPPSAQEAQGERSPFIIEGHDLIRNLDESLLGSRYLVRERETNQVKRAFVPSAEVLGQESFSENLERKVRSAHQIQHPNLLPVSGLFWQHGTAVVTTNNPPDFEPLSQVLTRRRTLQPQQAMEIVQQLTLGLEEAARNGMIHALIRPEIVLVSSDGRVLLDELWLPGPHRFLVQRSQGDTTSTEYYLAPEHLLADAPSDMRTDIFLLGALLHRMLVGDGLVTGYTAVEALNQFTLKSTENLGWNHLDKNVGFLLTRMTAKERRDRFQTYRELLAGLEPFLGASRLTGSQSRAGSRSRSHPHTHPSRAHRGRTGSVQRTTGTTGATSAHGRTGAHGRTTAGPHTGSMQRATGTGRGTHAHHTRSTAGPGRTRSLHRAGEDTGATARPGRKPSNVGPVIMAIGILAIVALGIFLINADTFMPNDRQPGFDRSRLPSKQHERTTDDRNAPTVDNDGEAEPADNDEDDTQTYARQLLAAAEKAIAAYAGSPADDDLFTQAQKRVNTLNISAIPADRRRELVTRLQQVRRDYLDERDSGMLVIEDDQQEEQQPLERLTAQQKAEINALVREGQWRGAIARLRSFNLVDAREAAHIAKIKEDLKVTKQRIETEVMSARSKAAIAAILSPVRAWDLPDADSWADRLQTTHGTNLPDSLPGDELVVEDTEVVETDESAGGENAAEDQDGDGDRTPPEDAISYETTIYPETPSGFKVSTIEINRRLDRVLRRNLDLEETATRLLDQLADNAVLGPALRLKVELWNQKHELVNQAVEDGARIRISNPIDPDTNWEVTEAKPHNLTLHSSTGTDMPFGWHEIGDQELARLFETAATTSAADGKDKAIGVIGSMIAGNTAQASLMARRLEAASYDHSGQIDQLVSFYRDLDTLQLFTEAHAAMERADKEQLEAIIVQLQRPNRIRLPQVAERTSKLLEALAGLKAGHRIAVIAGRPPTIATGARATNEPGKDTLTFDEIADRTFFTERKGGWLIADGAITSTADRCSLSREDLANATGADITFSFAEDRGTFTLDFRGVRVLFDLEKDTARIDSRGVTPKSIGLAWSAQTRHTVSFELMPAQEHMRVRLEQANPIDLPYRQLTDAMTIATDSGATLSIDTVSVVRGAGDAIRESDAKSTRLNGLDVAAIGKVEIDIDTEMITIPSDPDRICGLAVKLPDPLGGKLRFRLQGTGQLLMHIGDPAELATARPSVQALPKTSDVPITLDVHWNGKLYGISALRGGDNLFFAEKEQPAGATHFILRSTATITLPAPPETIDD